MEGKGIFQQGYFDFDAGKCRVVKNYWGECWHIKDLTGHTVRRAEGNTPFDSLKAAQDAAARHGLEVVV